MATAGVIYWSINGNTLYLNGNAPTSGGGSGPVYFGKFVQNAGATSTATKAGYTDIMGSWRDLDALQGGAGSGTARSYPTGMTDSDLEELLGSITTVTFANSVTPISCFEWFKGFNLDSCTITAGATGLVGTTAIKNTKGMFENAFKGSGKTLTLSFTPNGSLDSSRMFANNPGLESVTISAGTYAAATNISEMFIDCTSLKTINMAAATFAAAEDITLSGETEFP